MPFDHAGIHLDLVRPRLRLLDRAVRLHDPVDGRVDLDLAVGPRLPDFLERADRDDALGPVVKLVRLDALAPQRRAQLARP